MQSAVSLSSRMQTGRQTAAASLSGRTHMHACAVCTVLLNLSTFRCVLLCDPRSPLLLCVAHVLACLTVPSLSFVLFHSSQHFILFSRTVRINFRSRPTVLDRLSCCNRPSVTVPAQSVDRSRPSLLPHHPNRRGRCMHMHSALRTVALMAASECSFAVLVCCSVLLCAAADVFSDAGGSRCCLHQRMRWAPQFREDRRKDQMRGRDGGHHHQRN